VAAIHQQNAITRRLDRLVEMWEAFREESGALLCRWLVAADEYSMVEAFYEREASEGGLTPDVFLRFDTPFKDMHSYGGALRQAFIGMVEEDRELLQEEGIDLAWQAGAAPQAQHNSQLLSLEMAAFARQNPLVEDLMVAYLSPGTNEDVYAWVEWLMDAVAAGAPPNVRWMVVDTLAHPIFDQLAELYPQKVKTIRPELDMPAAMRELAAAGNPAEPGVQYRMAFVALTQAVGKQNWTAIEQHAKEALHIARENQWPHLMSSIHITVGNAEMSAGKNEEALMSYRKAEAVSEQAWKAGDAVCGKLLVQALFGQGAVYIAQQQHEQAAKIYAKTGQLAEEIKDLHYAMEAWRMAGYAHEWDKWWDDARQAYEKALAAGMQLDESMRPHTTLPYIGDALIRACLKSGHSPRATEVEHLMQQEIGDDWQKKLTR